MSRRLYEIKATGDTPFVSMDSDARQIWIKGVSMPENAFEFYGPVIEVFNDRFREATDLTLNIHLDYLNSMSNKQLLRFLMQIESMKLDAQVNWIYNKADDLMSAKGEELEDICPGINFKMMPQD